MEDIQSWWEVPSIAYFCSLFRSAFNLLDFDIEELEEALLTDGTEESASALLTELIVRLLNGCLGNNDISAFNYQMYLRRIFRRKCQETGRYNPFNTDIDFQFLPLRTKVEILYALCDFRLDAEDVFDLFKNLEAESLRVEPLGWDSNQSAYWYFYGTRLYREDIIKKTKGKNKKKKGKVNKKRGWFYGDDWLDDDESDRVWQVVCFTEEDWTHLTEKFSKATSKVEKELYRSLSQNFLPEIPRLFQEKEKLQRKRLLELAPRRTSSRVLQKIKQKEEENKPSESETTKDEEEDEEEDDDKKVKRVDKAREIRAKRRELLRTKSSSSGSESESSSSDTKMPQKATKRAKGQDKRSKNSSATQKGEPPPPEQPPVKTGRKTNNSLACATGQILIPDSEPEPSNSTRKKLKTSQIFSQTEEDIQTDMYKVLEQLTNHDDAWPFMDPVEEEYAPNYYAVIRRPMDLKKMEERLDSGHYTDFGMFKADFKLIVNNCRLYNGQDNEYTIMVDNLQLAFDRLTEKYMHRLSSSDEEIAVEYQIPTPSRKHKLKTEESPTNHKAKKRKSNLESAEGRSSSPDRVKEEAPPEEPTTTETVKESHHKSREGKGKKKHHKGHHRHGKHSKSHKKEHGSKSSKHSKKQKHSKNKDGKKSKQKKKKNKHVIEPEVTEILRRSISQDTLESSRSASPLPSIHTMTPSPVATPPPEPLNDPDFYKDKYDKIKERRRHAAKDAWDSLFDHKQKSGDKQKQNQSGPEKEKNQKLRETIEKLKAKNEKYKDTSLFNSLFTPGQSKTDKSSECSAKESSSKDKDESSDEEPISVKEKVSKTTNKKKHKKNSSAKNESASEALEQAVKDISKWLDDAPKCSNASSPSESPAHTISTEEQDSRQDDEFPQSDKSFLNKKDLSRKRTSSREPKVVKRREIQRTIDRLQPGKSKGNLLTNPSSKNVEKVEEVAPLCPFNKVRDSGKSEESSPKLSLGSVLQTVEFTLGKDHNFVESELVNELENKKEENKEVAKESVVEKVEEPIKDTVSEAPSTSTIPKKMQDAIVETEPEMIKPSQEKATPNLSAWFKAFGAPKSTPSAVPTTKKKAEETETEEKGTDTNNENKPASPKTHSKYDSTIDPETPNPEGGESPTPNITNTPRQRRTSTGSSVSERSSFSQDLDSPRHQLSHTSPLLRSPASPRTDEFQKITYPIINGPVRAGFYQDTTSIKSSPEKSCSPREGPQSPFSPYSQHVYASNNPLGSTTPNYFLDPNKSPLPSSYGQNQQQYYYDAAKTAAAAKPPRAHDEYIFLAPETYLPLSYEGPASPPVLPQSVYSQAQISPQIPAPEITTQAIVSTNSTNVAPTLTDPKITHFPMKKRTYNESENSNIEQKKIADVLKETAVEVPNKNNFPHESTPALTMPSKAVADNISAEQNVKPELAKMNNVRDKHPEEFINRQMTTEARDTIVYDTNEASSEKEEALNLDLSNPTALTAKENIDMVNMGYMNPEIDRRVINENHLNNYSVQREAHKPTVCHPHPKGYEIDAIAMNLGMNSQNIQKSTKTCVNPPMPAVRSQDRIHTDIGLSQPMNQQYAQYDMANQAVSNFSLSDIELANKKLYACNSSPSNYGNWKLNNQMRKQDISPSDYSTTHSANNTDKIKSDISSTNTMPVNYNKNLQSQQYQHYNVPRSVQRTQEIQQNLPSELRIPNPRGHLKSDHASVSTSHNNDLHAKSSETSAKQQKPEKMIQNHPLVGSLQYKTPYTHATSALESFFNLPNIPQMLERYSNDERYLSSLYHDKTYQMAQMSQMFSKSMSSDVHPVSTSASIYSQPTISISKDTSIYKSTPQNLHNTQVEAKNKKKKRTTDPKPTMASQGYTASSGTADVLASVKSAIVPGSAFNFGASANMALGSGLYGDNSGFTIEDFRNNANQLMAANYMAAVAHQRSNPEANTDKMVKPAHQNSSHASGSFSFMGQGQRAAYPFVGADTSSPLYQQYLQRHQEELLRQTGAQIMGLYPPGYPAALAARQPYDTLNRPSWL